MDNIMGNIIHHNAKKEIEEIIVILERYNHAITLVTKNNTKDDIKYNILTIIFLLLLLKISLFKRTIIIININKVKIM